MKKGLFIILCGLLILTVGCSKKDKVTKKTFETSLDTQFNAAVNMVEDEEVPEFLSELEDRNGYEILSFEEDGQVADAVVRVKAPDLYSAAKKIQEKEFSTEEEVLEYFAEEMKNAEIIETEVELQFEYVDGKWSPILTSEFMDAYYGGILKFRDEFYQEAVKGGEYLE